jgi:hypothetical protein
MPHPMTMSQNSIGSDRSSDVASVPVSAIPRPMRPVFVVVPHEFVQHRPKVLLVEDNEVVKALAAVGCRSSAPGWEIPC